MEFLWIILGWLFPADPVRQCITALRQQVALLAASVLREDCLIALESDPACRIDLETTIIDLEATLQLVIGSRACQIAGLPVVTCSRGLHPPTRARPTLELLARLGDLARALDQIERLAQLRALRLKREREADPLGLAGHDRATRVGCWRLSRCAMRPAPQSSVQTPARGPPPTIV